MSESRRGPIADALLISLVAAGATWSAMLSWTGFVEVSSPYLLPLLVLGAVVAGTGALTRWWGWPSYAVLAGQLVLSTMALSLVLTGSPWPVGTGWARLVGELADAVTAAQTYPSPVPADAEGSGVYPLLIAGGLVCLLLVDLLACTVRRVPLAGLPLLTVYSLPVSILGGGLSWPVFLLTAAGFLCLLYLHENQRVTAWGRALPRGTDPGGFSVRTGATRTTALAIGGLATAMALVVPTVVPTLSLSVFDFGSGAGRGDTITVENPIADLRRNLRREVDLPLLRVVTEDPQPAYLRISVLNRFSENEWSSGDRDVPTQNQPAGAMPELQGVSPEVGRESFGYRVSVSEQFESTWLPTQAPVSAVEAPGDWRFDPRTMDFIASDDDLTTAGLSYTMTAVDLDLSGSALSRASPSTTEVDDEYTELPSSVPATVSELAREVTRESETRFDKAVALQDWFRENFTYSLKQAEQANGVDALAQFLSPEGRVGYCEQFAASMAAMSRSLGIPARVAVGFLRPERIGPNTWEYSAYDLHAWPELYFEGFGWVRFEPTPARRASGVPGYTENRPSTAAPPGQPGAAPSAQPGPRPDDRPQPSARPEVPEAPTGTAEDDSSPWVGVVLALLAIASVVALVWTPQLLRRRRRDRHLESGPEGAWLELEATALDLGLPWPPDRSPREARDEMVRWFGAPEDEFTPERPARGAHLAPDAVLAADRLVHELELLRYSRTHTGTMKGLRAEVMTCAEAMRNGVGPRRRRRARWLPMSLASRTHGPRSRDLRDRSGDVSAQGAEVFEHLNR